MKAYKKIACVGIGGSGVYYVAKYFLLTHTQVEGYDIQESEKTKELASLGATIQYQNPSAPFPSDIELFIYSPALPVAIIESLEKMNPVIPHLDTGTITAELIEQYRNKRLSEEEKHAFETSQVAPLFTLNQSKMKYIGVTGTDGKTSTCTMTYHMLKKLGYKPGLISTVSAYVGDKVLDTGFHTTTPTSQELYTFLKMMEDEKCTHVIIESTSHGLYMGRLAGISYDVVAYTNITSDHLDYHKTWDHYFDAKALLITEHTKKGATVILNEDDPRATAKLRVIAKELNRDIKTYSRQEKASLTARNIQESTQGLSFEVGDVVITLPILGIYNVSNALAAMSIVKAVTNMELKKIAPTLKDFQTVTGRMQILQKKPFPVIVDFAHTTFALESALEAAKKLKNKKNGRVIAVFGTAGNRDTTKRGPMGEIAGKFADVTILTAEDPRWEKLSDINDQVEQGWHKTANSKKQHLIRFDDDTLLVDVRRQAIKTALKLAKPGDVVIITGKAHEQSLCFGKTEYPWSDISETNTLLNTLNYV